MQVVVLGPTGPGRSSLTETLTRLGCEVMAQEPRPEGPLPPGGQVLVCDLRQEDADWAPLVSGLRADPRPLALVCERPRRLMRLLSGRPGGTIVLTGRESEAGYRVALSVCDGLHRAAASRATVRPTLPSLKVCAL